MRRQFLTRMVFKLGISLRNSAFAALMALMLFQFVKGLGLQPNIYPLTSYIFTYADGAVRRSLLSSLLALAGVQSIEMIAVCFGLLHLAMFVVFFRLLLSYYGEVRDSGDQRRLGLFWLMASSSVIPVLAALNGYFDIIMACGMLAIWRLLARGRAMTSAVLILLMGLQHEMALLYGVCLMAGQYLLVPEQRQRLAAGMLLVILAGGAGLYVSGLNRPALEPLSIERCQSMRPEAYPGVDEVWDIYCPRQGRATFATDFKIWRPILLPFVLMACGFFSIMLATTALVQARHAREPIKGLALLVLLAMPYGLVVLALDIDRIIVMASIINWLIIDRWLALRPQPAPHSPRRFAALIGVLVLLQLPLNYPSVDAYAQLRLIHPDITDRYLITPRLWVIPLMNRYGLKVPFNLDRQSCYDSRCAR